MRGFRATHPCHTRRYWRFPIGSAQKFEDLIYERCGKEEGDKAVEEWAALRKRLKTLGGSTTAVSLVNLRQDAGMIATTAGATPYVLTHPDVFLDLPLTFDSLHKTVGGGAGTCGHLRAPP